MKFKKGLLWIVALLLALSILFVGCDNAATDETLDDGNQIQVTQTNANQNKETEKESVTDKPTETADNTQNGVTLDNIPAFSGNPYVPINNNTPTFTESEITTKAYEFYSELDSLGRCGYAMASLGKETMPAPGEDRESISHIKPTGWINKSYDIIAGNGWLYNRSHLIGWQLSAENDNEKNLITGTVFMNTKGMLPFENQVADYIKETGNHVMYRVTPIFEGNNLLSSGVHIEAYSVEDKGDGISFNVYIYNVQEGITLNYLTGESSLTNAPEADNKETTDTNGTYIININPESKKIHLPDCASVKKMSDKNKKEHTGSLEEYLNDGYTPCGSCKPLG